MTAARDAADRLLAESLRAERERADKIYEAQEALQREENRLEAAQRQKRVVDKRAAELWRELLAHQQDDQLHEEGLKISEKDEIELAQEFKRALDHVLIHARHPTTTVHEEPAEVVGRLVVEEKEQAAEEQAEDEGEGDSRSESESEEDDGGAGPGEKDIKTVEWVRVAWRHLKRNSSGTPREEETVVTVRVHDTYTFADLKGDVCRHLNLAHRFDSMELYHNQREQAWPEDASILSEIRKRHLVSTERTDEGELLPPRIELRPLRQETKTAMQEQAKRKMATDLRSEIAAKAEAARRNSHYLRTLHFERKASRHGRSLIIRGVVHLAFTLLFAANISQGLGRGYESVDAVRRALAQTTFTVQSGHMASLSCEELHTAGRMADIQGVGGEEDRPHYAMRLDDVRHPEAVAAWMRGPLVDALAPRCAYSGQSMVYDNTSSGGIGFYHNMLTPLRLQQTRYNRSREMCGQTLSMQNYPNLQGDSSSPFPECRASNARSEAPYRGGGPGFTHTPDSAYLPNTTYSYCGEYGCYGPGGYISDTWVAKDYRSTIDGLLADGWIDGWTESVAAHVQLGNSQTGCLILATALFEFMDSSVTPHLHVHEVCAPLDAQKYSSDFDYIYNFSHRGAYHHVVSVLVLLYILRIVYVQYKVGRKVLGDVAVRGMSFAAFKQLFTVSYALDTVLGFCLALHAIATIIFDGVFKGFAKYIIDTKLAQIRLDPNLSNQLNAAVMSILTKSASGEISHDEQERAIGALKSAAFFSTVWDGSAYGASPVDLRMQVPFVSFSMITEIEVHLAGLRSIVFFVCVLKTLRYMQAWRPLAERYAAIMQNVPYILRFFLLLTHLHACFSVQAYLLFGFDLIEFQTLGSSFLQLLQLLTGKITVAKGLIELDYQSSSFIGHLFLFFYLFILVLSGSSIIIAVLTEGWSNATELLRHRSKQKRRLQRMEEYTRQAREMRVLKEELATSTDEQLLQMAAHSEQSAESAEEDARAMYKRGSRTAPQIEATAPTDDFGPNGMAEAVGDLVAAAANAAASVDVGKVAKQTRSTVVNSAVDGSVRGIEAVEEVIEEAGAKGAKGAKSLGGMLVKASGTAELASGEMRKAVRSQVKSVGKLMPGSPGLDLAMLESVELQNRLMSERIRGLKQFVTAGRASAEGAAQAPSTALKSSTTSADRAATRPGMMRRAWDFVRRDLYEASTAAEWEGVEAEVVPGDEELKRAGEMVRKRNFRRVDTSLQLLARD